MQRSKVRLLVCRVPQLVTQLLQHMGSAAEYAAARRHARQRADFTFEIGAIFRQLLREGRNFPY
jgi:hypothetical protein